MVPRWPLPPHSVSATYCMLDIFLSFSLKCGLNLSHQLIGEKQVEESIDKIELMDDDLSSVLTSIASTMQVKTLALEEEKKRSENLGGHGVEAATLSSFCKYCVLHA